MKTVLVEGARYAVHYTPKGMPVSIQLLKANGKPYRAVKLTGDLGRRVIRAAG